MKKKVLWIGLAVVIVLILGVGGKKYMDKKKLETDYQQGIELIQNYVTDYLINNYEGIEKIEWQGVGVEWRSSPIYGQSMFGNYVNSYVNVFVSKDTYFDIGFRLNDEAEYDYNLKKYLLKDYLNPKNIDSSLEMEIRNTTRKLNEENKLNFSKIKKSDTGSQNAETVYNLKIHELTY